MPMRLRDSEGAIFLNCRFLLLYAADFAPPRPAVQRAGKLAKPGGGPRGIDFHAAVVQIPRVSAQAKFGRSALGKITETDALHAAPDKKPAARARLGSFRPGHRVLSYRNAKLALSPGA